MKANESFISAVRAGFFGFYVQTWEIERTKKILIDEINSFNKSKGKDILSHGSWNFQESQNPDEVLEILENEKPFFILFAENYNWFLTNQQGEFDKNAVSFFQNNISKFSSPSMRKILVIISNENFEDAIPAPLQKDFVSLEFDLPNKEEIEKILEKVISDAKTNLPDFSTPIKEEIQNIVDSSKGLTKRELENAYSFSVIQDKGTIKAETIADIQARDIKKTAGLKIGKYNVGNLIGYERMKKFVLKTIKSPMAKGILILGPPGTGKTHFAKYIASQTGKKCIELELANLFGKYVGESERLMKEALQIITANSPCILFIDEIEKGLSGVGSGASGGSEVAERSMSQFLKFLSDERPEGVYVIATCNNISSLPPEWLRAERWDTAPFYVGLPEEETRTNILEYYKKSFNVEGELKDHNGWSGAELKSVCRIAAMMETNLEEAVDYIIPVSKTMGKKISELEKWAEGKTINAAAFEQKTSKRAFI